MWFGEAHRFNFDEMHTALMRVMNCEDLPPHILSAKTGRLLQVYQQERSRYEDDATKGSS